MLRLKNSKQFRPRKQSEVTKTKPAAL
uniref:Uncharacterized protein n=1 Tax=Anguilla anguilla TaxID=7936 RepID=A0A0E9Q124_ANGAN